MNDLRPVFDRNGLPLHVGEKVMCFSVGSWIDGRSAVITALHAERSGDSGVALQFEKCVSIVDAGCLEKWDASPHEVVVVRDR